MAFMLFCHVTSGGESHVTNQGPQLYKDSTGCPLQNPFWILIMFNLISMIGPSSQILFTKFLACFELKHS